MSASLIEIDDHLIDPEAYIAAYESVVAYAVAYAERGWRVFPAPASGEKKSLKSAKYSNGKNWAGRQTPIKFAGISTVGRTPTSASPAARRAESSSSRPTPRKDMMLTESPRWRLWKRSTEGCPRR
jgi:hypothetical protein